MDFISFAPRFVGRFEKGVEYIGDIEELKAAVWNLIDNAVKFSPKADRVIVRTRLDADGKHVTTSVQDFGIGIPRSEQEKIFDRFFQANHAGRHAAEGAPSTDTYPGLGLGLYISAEIVARHGGRISVESEIGKGSTFNFTLPVEPPHEE